MDDTDRAFRMATHPATKRRTRTDLRTRPDARSVLWAGVGGLVASVLIGIPMHMLGMLAMGPAALVGSSNVWVGWIVHLAAGIIFGAPYGVIVHTTHAARGLFYGAVWGLLVGVFAAWIALFTILGMPLFGPMAALDVGLHVAWGLILGVVQAWGLASEGVERRHRGMTRLSP